MKNVRKKLLKRPMVLLAVTLAAGLFLLLCVFPVQGEKWLGYEGREHQIKEAVEAHKRFGEVTLTGRILSKEGMGQSYQYMLWTKLDGYPFGFKVRVSTEASLLTGDLITVRGHVFFPEKAHNPGEWDAKEYALEKGYLFTIRSETVTIEKRVTSPIVLFLASSRDGVTEKIREMFEQPYAGVVSAMITGEKSLLETEEKELLRSGGISHIIAISGLHMSILADLMLKGLSLVLRKRKAENLTLFLLLSYALWTGGAISTLRAAIMFSMKILAQRVGREYDFYSSYAFSMTLLLLSRPMYIRSASFYLSFGALLGMQIGEAIVIHWRFFPYVIRKWFASSVGVTLVTTPISLWFFYEAAPLSFLMNLYVIPSVSLVFLFSLGAVILGFLSPAAGYGFSRISIALLKSYEAGSDWMDAIPYLKLRGRMSVWHILILVLLTIFLILVYGKNAVEEGKRKGRQKSAFVLSCVLFLLIPDIKKQVSFLYVGQGDCAVIEWHDSVFIMDAGPSYKDVIRPFLMREGIKTIDGLIVSHPDADHMAGALLLAKDPSFEVKTLILSDAAVQNTESRRELEEAIHTQGGEILRMKAGDGFSVRSPAERLFSFLPGVKHRQADLWFQVLSPGKEWDNENDSSLVVVMSMEGKRFLFTGDIAFATEYALIEEGISLKTDVLKIAHHGSGFSSSKEFLEAADPALSVISCGIHNTYGHPSKETLERLTAQQLPFRVTADEGCITLQIKHNQLYYSSFFRRTLYENDQGTDP